MKDKEFLYWLHQRLVEVHGENPNYDYMHKLRAIILSIPHKETTNSVISQDKWFLGILQDQLKENEDTSDDKED